MSKVEEKHHKNVVKLLHEDARALGDTRSAIPAAINMMHQYKVHVELLEGTIDDLHKRIRTLHKVIE